MINWWGYFNLTIILIYNTVMPIITLVRTCYTGASTCMPVIIVRNLFQTFLTGTLFLMAWVFIANAFTYKKSTMFYISKHLGRLQYIPSILFHILTINLSFFFKIYVHKSCNGKHIMLSKKVCGGSFQDFPHKAFFFQFLTFRHLYCIVGIVSVSV